MARPPSSPPVTASERTSSRSRAGAVHRPVAERRGAVPSVGVVDVAGGSIRATADVPTTAPRGPVDPAGVPRTVDRTLRRRVRRCPPRRTSASDVIVVGARWAGATNEAAPRRAARGRHHPRRRAHRRRVAVARDAEPVAAPGPTRPDRAEPPPDVAHRDVVRGAPRPPRDLGPHLRRAVRDRRRVARRRAGGGDATASVLRVGAAGHRERRHGLRRVPRALDRPLLVGHRTGVRPLGRRVRPGARRLGCVDAVAPRPAGVAAPRARASR